eukprot:4849846-Pyramimonas_sp.AAC.1
MSRGKVPHGVPTLRRLAPTRATRVQNPKPKTLLGLRPKTQNPNCLNPKAKSQEPRAKTQDPRLKTQDPRPKTQDPNRLKPSHPPGLHTPTHMNTHEHTRAHTHAHTPDSAPLVRGRAPIWLMCVLREVSRHGASAPNPSSDGARPPVVPVRRKRSI